MGGQKMTREEAKKYFVKRVSMVIDGMDKFPTIPLMAYEMAIEALSEDKWIPIQYHEITEEEREENGYPKDWVYFLDCVMPQDEQEILVQTKNGEVRWDVCYEEDGFILDSGWDWIDDIVAWMPLPKPYRAEGIEP